MRNTSKGSIFIYTGISNKLLKIFLFINFQKQYTYWICINNQRNFIHSSFIIQLKFFFAIKNQKGDIPTARKGHQALYYNKLLYIIGGKTATPNEDTFQIHALNYGILIITASLKYKIIIHFIETNVWKKIPTIGKPPAPRSFFTANLFSQNRLIVK